MAPTAPSLLQRMGPAAMAAGGILAFLLIPAMLIDNVGAQIYAYTVQAGTDYPLNDIRPTDGPMNAQACGYLAYSDTSAADCETRCNAADACAGFVQVNDVPCCFLKSKLVNQNANSRTVTHLKSNYPGPTAPALPYTYTVQPNTDYYLNDIRPSDGPLNANVCGYLAYSDTSPTDCETRCDAAAGCAGFVHVADNNCCFLKGNVDSPSANSRTIAHLKTGLPRYVVAYGKDNPNNDIVPPAGAPTNAALCGGGATLESLGACIARCDNAGPACVGIAHYPDNDCCYLKSALGAETLNTRVASHRKIITTTPPPTNQPPTVPSTTTPPRTGGGGGAGVKN